MNPASKSKKLHAYHVIFLVQSSMIGYSILLLPNIISPAGHNQWVVVLLMALAAQVSLYPIIKLGLLYPNSNLYKINEILLGKGIGKTVTSLFVLYGIAQLSLVASGYIKLITSVSLPGFQWFGPLLFLFAVIIYVVHGGIRLLARLSILAFVITGWMLYLLKWSFREGDLTNLLPLFNNLTWSATWKSFHAGFEVMLGYELILIYFPYIADQKGAFKHASIGIWIASVFYLAVSLASVIYLSEWELTHARYPVLKILKSVELTFVERIENFALTLWVFLVVTTIGLYFWSSKKALDSLMGKSRPFYMILCAALAFLIIDGPFSPTLIEYFSVIHFSALAGYAVIVWCYFLLLIHYIKKIGKGAKQP